jgi:hypothetical protein
MARSIGEIYAAMVSDKDNQTSLAALAPTADTEQQLQADLNSTSKVAVWRLWAYLVSVSIHVHEGLFDLFRIEINEAASRAIVGTAAWYQRMVLAFQFGEVLVFNSATGGYGYAALNAAAQVVKRCAVVEDPNGNLVIKVAGLNGSGKPVALSGVHQSGLSAYFHKMRFAGTLYQIVSGNGDILKVSANVYYHGSSDPGVVKLEVEAAINGYVGNLSFNGEFLLSKMVDAIQAVSGVYDIQLVSVQTKAIVTAIYTPITRSHVPQYGYYVVDASVGNGLGDTINYFAV